MTDPFYLSPFWRRLRAAALRRDGNRCIVCGARAVVVDHVVSRRRGGPDALNNLRSLCRAHDQQVKERPDGWRKNGGVFKGCDPSGTPSDPNHPWHRS